MENKEKEKIKEPYTPENTPTPPQQIDPSIKNERNESNPAGEDKKRKPASQEEEHQKGSGKQLGDPTEITDETTI